MDIEELKDIFEQTESDISNLKGDNAFIGLEIIKKYSPDSLIEGAGHDVIYSIDIEMALKISRDDLIKLRELNWMFDEESDCLACFV